MKHIFYLLLLGILMSTLASCVLPHPLKRRSHDYYFNTQKGTTIKEKAVHLDTMKSILVVPEIKDLMVAVKNIHYFDTIITLNDLELQIIAANKQDEVGALAGRIGLNKAARYYKPFLILDFHYDDENPHYFEIRLTDPRAFEDIFIAKTVLMNNINRSNFLYPLMNELILYIEENSETYDRLEGIE